MLYVLCVIFFILAEVIYHKIFDVTYFGCRAFTNEIIVCFGIAYVLALVIVDLF